MVNRNWTPNEIDFVRTWYGRYSTAQIANRLGRSPDAVRRVASEHYIGKSFYGKQVRNLPLNAKVRKGPKKPRRARFGY